MTDVRILRVRVPCGPLINLVCTFLALTMATAFALEVPFWILPALRRASDFDFADVFTPGLALVPTVFLVTVFLATVFLTAGFLAAPGLVAVVVFFTAGFLAAAAVGFLAAGFLAPAAAAAGFLAAPFWASPPAGRLVAAFFSAGFFSAGFFSAGAAFFCGAGFFSFLSEDVEAAAAAAGFFSVAGLAARIRKKVRLVTYLPQQFNLTFIFIIVMCLFGVKMCTKTRSLFISAQWKW